MGAWSIRQSWLQGLWPGSECKLCTVLLPITAACSLDLDEGCSRGRDTAQSGAGGVVVNTGSADFGGTRGEGKGGRREVLSTKVLRGWFRSVQDCVYAL